MSCALVKDGIFFHNGKEMCGTCSKYEGEMCTGFGRQTWYKELLVRPRRKRGNNTKMVIQGVGWGHGMNFSASE
jgi:hypothetical protein